MLYRTSLYKNMSVNERLRIFNKRKQLLEEQELHKKYARETNQSRGEYMFQGVISNELSRKQSVD
jgi:hypothetical protein